MLPTLKPLLYKESREHLGKLAALSLIYLTPIALGLASSDIRRQEVDPGGILSMSLLTLSSLCPAFVAMSTIAREHSARTHRALAALPIPPWHIFAVKSLFGLLVLLLPLAAANAILLLAAPHNPEIPPRICFSLGMLAWSAQLYLLTLFLTATFTTETRTALVGILLPVFLIGLYYSLAVNYTLFEFSYSKVPPAFWLHPASPMLEANRSFVTSGTGFIFRKTVYADFFTALTLQSFLAAILFVLASLRYHYHALGRRMSFFFPKNIPHKSRSAPAKRSFPSGSTLAPLLWKTWRETRLILAFSFAALLIPFLLTLNTPRDFVNGNDQYGEYHVSRVDGSLLRDLIHYNHYIRSATTAYGPDGMRYTAQLAAIVGVLVAIILGIGPAARDLRPKLSAFWRSRPIPIRSFFLAQYLGSLAASLLIAILPIAAILIVCSFWLNAIGGKEVRSGYVSIQNWSRTEVQPTRSERVDMQIDRKFIIGGTVEFRTDFTGPDLARTSETARDSLYSSLIIIPWVFSLGSLLTALFRRPVYAALLTIGITSTLWLLPLVIRLQTAADFFNPGQDLAPPLFLLLAAAASYATYRATRADWSLARH